MGINDSVIAEQIFVSRVVAILLKEGEILKSGKEPNYHFWIFFKEFMQEYIEKHHMYKQEKLLNHLLTKKLQAEHKERILKIIEQHEHGRKMTAVLNEILGESFGNNETTLTGLKNIILSFEENYYHHSREELHFVQHYIENHFNETSFKEFEILFEEYDDAPTAESFAKRAMRFESAYL